jgi:hypothetical protein
MLPGFVPAAELKPAQDEVPAMYPTAEGFHNGTDERRDRFTVDEWAGIDSFPFRSTELSLLAVSDRVVDLAQALLADKDLRIYSAEAWAKYTGAADYDQPLHRDYLNQTLMVPTDDPRFRQLEMFVYLVDVPPGARAAEHGVPYPHDGASCEAELVPARRRHRRRGGLGRDHRKPGSLRCRGPGRRAGGHGHRLDDGNLPPRHRLALPRGARYTLQLAYRPARAEWGQRMPWPSRSHELEWYRFVHRATPRQLALFSFPPPGHAYWTEATLAGTAQRYPRLDMTPWRQALRGEA